MLAKANFKPNFLVFNTVDTNIDSKILQDYYKFFTTEEGADMLPYVYLENPRAFDNLVKNCDDYYLFKEEVELLQNSKKALTNYLDDITSIIEIGPGSTHSVMHKTLSVLQCAPHLKNYYPIDISKKYLNDACEVVGSKFPRIRTLPIAADMMNLFNLKKIAENNQEKKALLLLGSTLGGQTPEEQDLIITGISKILSKDDIFIITVDTNNDEKSLMKAYSNNHELHYSVLSYFSNAFSGFSEFVPLFKPQCCWNDKGNYVDIYYTASEKLNFNYPAYGIINISQGQNLRGIKSRKFNIEYIRNKLEKSDFSVVDFLSNNNRMNVILCKRS